MTTDHVFAAPVSGAQEVLFIDSRVPDLQAILAATRPGVKVVILDPHENGVAQMARALQGEHGLASISVVSHGDEGLVLLGDGALSSDNLEQYQAQLQEIGAALGPDGDLLLYGCDVGAGEVGAQFLQSLAQLTGADVAASEDRTAGGARGGDWDLEVTTGRVDAPAVLDAQQLQGYDASLVTTGVGSLAQLKAAIASGSGDGQDDLITLTGNITFASAADTIAIAVTDGHKMSILGGGFTLSGNNLARVLDVSSSGAGSSVAIDNLTITNGFLTGNGGNVTAGAIGGNGADALGAGIKNAGTLTITNSTVTSNKAAGGGGSGSQVGGGAGGGGGGGGFGSTHGGDGGLNPASTPATPSAPGIGGDGAGYVTPPEFLGGRGGSTTGGAGGTWSGYATGGAGATANNGSISIGGGGGGAGYERAGGRGGDAAGAIYNTGFLTILSSSITNNIAAGGGGGGGAMAGMQSIGGNGGAGGAGIGGIWNKGGTVWLDASSNSSLSVGNAGGGGSGGDASKANSAPGAAGAATSSLLTTNGGTQQTNYVPDLTAPTVTSVTSTTSDGLYRAGNVISIQVNFSEAVFVTGGTPQLTLETGATDRSVNYASGSGTSTLTFTYTVQAGDTAADLDYTGTSALALNGSTLRDAAGNNATLTLPSPGAANSLGANSNIGVDSIAPTTSIASAEFLNDSGTPGDFITNSAAQTISGTLSANLASDETVYVSINNGATWVAANGAAGQNSWSLAGVTLAGNNTLNVVVRDAAGNDGPMLSQPYQLDTTGPSTAFSNLHLSQDTGASSTDFVTHVAAQTISATLSSALTASDSLYGSLDGGATWTDITAHVSGTALEWTGVTLSGNGTLQLRVTDAAGNNGSVVPSQAYVLDTVAPASAGTPVLAPASDTGVSNSDNVTADNTPTLSGTAENGTTVSVYDGATLLGTVTAGLGGWTYTSGVLSEGSHSFTAHVADLAGNAASPSSALAVSIDTSAPTVTSVSVPANATYFSGDTLDFTVNFSEAVLVDTSGGTPRIAIVIGASTVPATYVSGSGSGALTFRYIVQSGDVDANGITVGALQLQGGALADLAGNQGVTTLNSVGSTAGVLIDGTNPSVVDVDTSASDGAYPAGAAITITVSFSTAVDVDTTGGVPTLALSSGGTATYVAGSGTNTLSFSYVVGAGENSADLDASSSSALALNGATIVDAGGAHQPAALTLPAPGTAGSLGANAGIVIDTDAPANTGASVMFSADTGSLNNDLVTKTASQSINGTLQSNLASGDSVQVSLDNGASWSTATATVGSNAWQLVGQTLSGSNTLQVRVVDSAGNAGTAYQRPYVLDTTAPGITVGGVALSNDTGTSTTDFITNAAAQTITATLSTPLAASDIVYGSLDNGASWTDITSKVSGTTLSWNGVTLAASNTLQIRVTDVAGNDGVATSIAYVLDTSAPGTSIASVGFSADTGVSLTDFITKTPQQTVSGTLSAPLAAGESVLVSLDNGATWSTASATVGTDSWSLSGQTLSASNTLLVTVTDRAGNIGPVLGQSYVLDTVATVATVSPLTTTSLTPVLTGSAALAAGDSMTVTVGGATYAVTPVAGAWSLDLATAVPTSGALTLVLNNRYEVVATVTDLAGNVGTDTTTGELLVGTVTVPPGPDPEPPVTPPVTPPTPGVPDNDGIPPTVEDQNPGIPGPDGTTVPGDGNGDGIRDSEQPSVGSIGFVLSPTGESNPGNAPPTFTTLVASSQNGKVASGNDNARITSLEQLDAPRDLPAGMQMPIGLVSFTVELGAGKTGENFSLYLDPALGINGYWKQDAGGQWVNIASEPYGGKTVMEGGRVRLDFHIEDGGQFDADGKVDGVITDPGAPAYVPLSITGQAPDVPHGFWF